MSSDSNNDRVVEGSAHGTDPVAQKPAIGKLDPKLHPDNVLPNLLIDVREGFLAAFRPVFRGFKVTDQQFRVLSILNSLGDLEIGRLAKHCRILAPSMTGILNRMVELGWVVRKPLRGQRWGLVSLTLSGRRLAKQLIPAVLARGAEINAEFGPDHLARLVDLLLLSRATLRNIPLRDATPQPTSRRRSLREKRTKSAAVEKRGRTDHQRRG